MNIRTGLQVAALFFPLSTYADPPARPAASVSAPLIVNVLSRDGFAVVVRKYQLDFYSLPKGVSVDGQASYKKKRLHFTKDSRTLAEPLKPLKSYSFKHKIDVRHALPEKLSSVITVCSDLV